MLRWIGGVSENTTANNIATSKSQHGVGKRKENWQCQTTSEMDHSIPSHHMQTIYPRNIRTPITPCKQVQCNPIHTMPNPSQPSQYPDTHPAQHITSLVTTTPPPLPRRPSNQHLPPLLLQRNPHPQPTYRLDEHERKKHSILQPVAAPSRGRIVRIRMMQTPRARGKCARVGRIERRRCREEEGVED